MLWDHPCIMSFDLNFVSIWGRISQSVILILVLSFLGLNSKTVELISQSVSIFFIHFWILITLCKLWLGREKKVNTLIISIFWILIHLWMVCCAFYNTLTLEYQLSNIIYMLLSDPIWLRQPVMNLGSDDNRLFDVWYRSVIF